MTRFADNRQELGDRDAGRVDAGLPNFWEPGTRAAFRARLPRGGRSNKTPLRSPRARDNDPRVHALAQGSDYAGGGAVRPPAVLLFALLALTLCTSSFAQDRRVRVKDLVAVKGADTNYLEGIGLVVGLAGTGDSQKELSQAMTAKWLQSRDDIRVQIQKDLQNKNVAVVAVSAELPAFQELGTTIDVKVSSVLDAKSLRGGRLLITPLHGPKPLARDENVYATAVGGLQIDGGATGNLTTASIPGGAKVVTMAEYNIFEPSGASKAFTLLLKRPDWNVASLIAGTLNDMPSNVTESVGPVGTLIAEAKDEGQIRVYIRTKPYLDRPAGFVALVLEQQIGLTPFQEPEAVVVINERAGTYGVSGYVSVSPGSVQKGNLRITIPYQPQQLPPAGAGRAAQPQPVAGAPTTAQLNEILANLGAVGFTPADIIDLIKTMDSMGLINGKVKSE